MIINHNKMTINKKLLNIDRYKMSKNCIELLNDFGIYLFLTQSHFTFFIF